MRETRFDIPSALREELCRAIAEAGGNEVFFLGRVHWSREGEDMAATLEEVELAARGNRESVPAVIHRAEDWDLVIHNHPGGDLEPSSADIGIAAELGGRSVGFVIISSDAERLYVVTPPFPSEGPVPLDLEEVRAVFEPGGPLSRGLEGWEARDGQVDMALEVARSLNEDRVLAAEAGTGIGKSFAYLVPAILWAVKNRERVIVSTGTIHLQEQLVGKDLPLLARVLPVPFRHALAKGRNNYLCRRKLEDVRSDLAAEGILEHDETRREYEDILAWAALTRDGSRSDLAWTPSPQVWDDVMSETDKSLKVNCPHYARCFFYEAKRAASSAHVVVVNHHLFFADLAVRRETGNFSHDAVLPHAKRVIFDEAHHLEDVASEYFGFRLGRQGLVQRLFRLRPSRSRRHGTVPRMVERLRALGDPIAADSLDRMFEASVPETIRSVEAGFEGVADALDASALPTRASSAGEDPDGGGAGGAGAVQLRYKGDIAEETRWASVAERLREVQDALGRIVQVGDRARRTLEGARLPEEKRSGMLLEMASAQTRFQGILLQIERFLEYGDAARVRWLERRMGSERRGPVVEIGFAPVRVSEDMKSAVYDPLRTVVLTSATLTVGGGFEFIPDRLGLGRIDAERFRSGTHASPFDYRSQVLTAVPTDLPAPDSREFPAALPGAVLKILEATGGRAFVLFTSFHLLRRTRAALEAPLLGLGLRPIAQGDAPRSEILERFRTGAANVLFGTDSFWEGVDVKGRALECVIITRLPFRVPSEPVQEARMEDIERRGGNAFVEFTVPQAVLKFKQGFGRLIRSKSDRGVVVVLDRRILSKPYGRVFLRSLPETDLRKAALEEIVSGLRVFFRAADPAAAASPLPAPRMEAS